MAGTVLVWLLQDILQVIFMGIMLVPEIFLLGLLFAGLQPEDSRGHSFSWYIFAGFIGGLIWDLRWTNVPGITAALNGGLLSASFIIWRMLPIQGRDSKSFAFIAFAEMFISALVHCFFWTVSSSVAIRLFIIQQLVGVIFVLLLTLVYRKKIYRHV